MIFSKSGSFKIKYFLTLFISIIFVTSIFSQQPPGSSDTAINPNSNHKSEMSVAAHPLDNRILLVSANTHDADFNIKGIGYYISFDGGLTWDIKVDETELQTLGGDPTSGIDKLDNFYVSGMSRDPSGIAILR